MAARRLDTFGRSDKNAKMPERAAAAAIGMGSVLWTGAAVSPRSRAYVERGPASGLPGHSTSRMTLRAPRTPTLRTASTTDVFRPMPLARSAAFAALSRRRGEKRLPNGGSRCSAASWTRLNDVPNSARSAASRSAAGSARRNDSRSSSAYSMRSELRSYNRNRGGSGHLPEVP